MNKIDMIYFKKSVYIFCSCLLFSCASINTFVINVENPAQVTIPAYMKRIVLVDNSSKDATNLGNDSLRRIFIEKMAEALNETRFFDTVSPCPDSLLVANDSLSKKSIFYICNKLNVNTIVSVDQFVLDSSTRKSFTSGYELDSLIINTQINFNVYGIYGKKRAPSIIFIDSTSWVEVREHNALITNPLPPFEKASKEALMRSAYKLQTLFAPSWNSQYRWIYTNMSAKMTEANNDFNSNRLDKVIASWKTLFDAEKSNQKRAQLASNIAVAYELSDKLYLAYKWIKVCTQDLDNMQKGKNESTDLYRAVIYEEVLKQRIIDNKQLNQQLGEKD